MLIAERGPIDILVNNAGVTVLGTVLETSLAEVERVFRVNFLAAYALMRAVLPGMARAAARGDCQYRVGPGADRQAGQRGLWRVEGGDRAVVPVRRTGLGAVSAFG